jgi:hypothetical protein
MAVRLMDATHHLLYISIEDVRVYWLLLLDFFPAARRNQEIGRLARIDRTSHLAFNPVGYSSISRQCHPLGDTKSNLSQL